MYACVSGMYSIDCIVHTCTQVNKRVYDLTKSKKFYIGIIQRCGRELKKKRDKKVGLHESMMLWTGVIRP